MTIGELIIIFCGVMRECATSLTLELSHDLKDPFLSEGHDCLQMRPRPKRSSYDIRAIWRQYNMHILAVVVLILALVSISFVYPLLGTNTAS